MNRSLLKLKDILHREERLPFYHQLDLYGIEDGIVIGTSGRLAAGYLFDGKDLLLEPDVLLEDFENRMRRFLNTLPERVRLHFLVKSSHGNSKPLKDYQQSIGCKDLLAQKVVSAKADGFHKEPFQTREVFLYIIHDPSPHKKSTRSFNISRAFGHQSREFPKLEYHQAKDILLKASAEIENGLNDLGFTLSRLTDGDILQYLFEVLNPTESVLLPVDDESNLRRRDGESLRSQLLLASPRVEEKFFYLDGFYHKGINLRLAPDETTLKSMRDFELTLGKDYLLSISIEASDQDKEKERIRRQGNFARAESFFSKSGSHDAQHQSEESNAFLSLVADQSDRLFHTTLCVIVKSQSLEKVTELAVEALRAFPKLGDARGLEDDMNHDRLFLCALPLEGDHNPLSFLIRSEALIHLLPLQASWKGTDKPGLLLKTWRGEPLRLDLFDPGLSSKHALMLGSTGSGKSFFNNHLLLHFLIESPDHEVVVMDIGGSYRKLCQIFGGNYVELECSEEYGLNPFPVKKLLFPQGGQDVDATFLQFLKELLEQMIAPERIWSGSEKMILENVLREVYRQIPFEEAPLLGDIEETLLNYRVGDDDDKRRAYIFAKELSLFTRGEYGKILNQKKTFDYNARFTVFDLRKIANYPELQEILLLIIPFALRRRFENINIKKLLVLDECWRFLKEIKGIDLIENFYRTARKLNAGVWSITQNPEDYLESRIAGVMINNSPVKYILRLKRGHDKLAMFGLNENEIQATRELEVRPGHYSECFVKFDNDRAIVRLSPNPLEYWIATTDAQDLGEETRFKNSMPKTAPIEVMESLAKSYPHGVKKVQLQEAP